MNSADAYDSTRQRCQLFVPAAYDASKAWPLVLFLSSGDDPRGWSAWQKTCENQAVIFCAPYGAGDNVAPAQRVRILLDALDDVRRRCHVDADQTYLAGFGGGGRIACAAAFALPEFFGGVVVAGEGTPLNGLEYLRWRARDRLSVALIAAGKDHPLSPYFGDMEVRCKTWAEAKVGADGPPAETLAEAYAWMAADLDRRRAEARAHPQLAAPDEAYTNVQAATLAVDAAKAELARTDGVYRAATLLEGVDARWGRTQPADAARALLTELRADAPRRKKWEDERDAEERRTLAAQAHLAERLGDLYGAIRNWGALAAAHGATPEGKKALEEVKRLTTTLATTPYLGLTVDDELVVRTVAPGGPAAAAGLKVGDRLTKLGATTPATTDDLRTAMQGLKPGDVVQVDVVREGQGVVLSVKVGSAPAKE
ncbi:MAG TPA: PDZ domain-containing protein [Gemmataceae bacterium]|nr:PDZ domain-containing protein [Gemmataceae bacterium]